MLKFSGKKFIFIIVIYCVVNTVAADQKVDNHSNSSLLSRTLLLDAASREGTSILVGERGIVFSSKENSPWQIAQLPVSATLTAVYLHDRNLGWAVGHDAVIFRTENGGEDWQEMYSAPDDEIPLLDVWFNDENFGIAIGGYGLYLKTTNGGDSWIPQAMHVISMEDQNENTENQDDLTESYDLHLNAIAQSASGRIYIVAEAGRIYRSDDLGQTWLDLPSPYIGSFFGILPLQDETVLVFGLRGHLYRSEDAGVSWTEVQTNTREMLTNGLRLDDGRIVIVGMGGTILSSHDQGRTFTRREFGHRNSYSAVIENSDSELIITGDHGVETYTMQELGTANE